MLYALSNYKSLHIALLKTMNNDNTLTERSNVFHFFQGVQAAVPVVLGYVPIAISFGVLAGHYGFSLLGSVLMSATVYAGASQFLAVEMSLTDSIWEIAFVVFLINLRHLVMTYSLLPYTRSLSLIKRVLIFSGITDETYAILSLSRRKSLQTFAGMGGLVLASYLSWVFSTAIGVWFASLIPASVSNSMSIALYALFVGLLVTALLQEPKYISLVFITIVGNVTLGKLFNPTFALFLSITLIPALYVSFIMRKKS